VSTKYFYVDTMASDKVVRRRRYDDGLKVRISAHRGQRFRLIVDGISA